MKVIILCGGKGSRWNDYLGVKKHHIEIDGERLIDRTIRLCDGHDVVIADKVDTTDAYAGDKVVGYNKDDVTTKFHDSLHLWENEESVALLYGDVWFSEEGLNAILSCDKDWAIAGRFGASTTTGCPHGELFGFVCRGEGINIMRKHIEALAKVPSKWAPTGSQHVRNLWGVQELIHNYPNLMLQKRDAFFSVTNGHFIEIDDWTDDFDEPGDYRRFVQNREIRGLKMNDDEQSIPIEEQVKLINETLASVFQFLEFTHSRLNAIEEFLTEHKKRNAGYDAFIMYDGMAVPPEE